MHTSLNCQQTNMPLLYLFRANLLSTSSVVQGTILTVVWIIAVSASKKIQTKNSDAMVMEHFWRRTFPV